MFINNVFVCMLIQILQAQEYTKTENKIPNENLR